MTLLCSRLPYFGRVQSIQRVYRTFQRCHLSFYYNEKEFRKQLITYSGDSASSVDLSKNSEDGIATIMLNNPDKENCLTGKMMVDLSDIVTDLENWPDGKGVILHSAKGRFCSGGDLQTVSQIMDPISGAKMCLFMQNVTSRLLNLPMVSVALVEGRALGGGAELLTACDYRLMAPDAKIAFVQVKLNVVTGWGGGTRLVNLIGRQKALDLLTSGRVVNSEEALKMGLVDKVLRDMNGKDPLSCAREWLTQYTFGSAKTVRAIKKIVSAAATVKQETALHKEKERFASVWGSEEHKRSMSKGMKHRE